VVDPAGYLSTLVTASAALEAIVGGLLVARFVGMDSEQRGADKAIRDAEAHRDTARRREESPNEEPSAGWAGLNTDSKTASRWRVSDAWRGRTVSHGLARTGKPLSCDGVANNADPARSKPLARHGSYRVVHTMGWIRAGELKGHLWAPSVEPLRK
jgi:hypothetical protein